MLQIYLEKYAYTAVNHDNLFDSFIQVGLRY